MKIIKIVSAFVIIGIGCILALVGLRKFFAWRRVTFQTNENIATIGFPLCLPSNNNRTTNEADCYTGFYGIETGKIYQVSDSACRDFPSPLISNKGIFIVRGVLRKELIQGDHLVGIGTLEVDSYRRIIGTPSRSEKQKPCSR